MQTINDGTHDILPAAVAANSRPDRARVPVTMPRQTDGKMRLDGSGAAKGQPEDPVDERGRVQGASELEAAKSKRAMANDRVYSRIQKEKRRCPEDRRKHNRLRGQDKRAHIALRSGCCFCTSFLRLRHLAEPKHKVCACRKWRRINDFPHIAKFRHER